jgi:hypothetical protein
LNSLSEPATAPPVASQPLDSPRIALITPVRNSGKYIEQTIESVLAQCYPNLEYWIIDGGSTDETPDVIRKYERQITGWLSEPDNGMYDALNKGFARTSGEIMGWLNASDQLQAGALRAVAGAFAAFPQVEWLTGRPTWLNEEGVTFQVGEIQRWSRWRYLVGANKYIQQESTFWKRSLWDRAGGYLDTTRGPVGDFDLWVRFFRHAQLYSVDALVGAYRMHKGSWGEANLAESHRTHDKIVDEELARLPKGMWLRAFRRAWQGATHLRGIRYAWWRLVETPLYRLRGPDWPPVLRCSRDKGWLMEK